MRTHPPDHELVRTPTPPEVQRHLDTCPRCRIERRMLRSCDPWANAVNSSGESADLCVAFCTNIPRVDRIASNGRPTFLVNTVFHGLELDKPAQRLAARVGVRSHHVYSLTQGSEFNLGVFEPGQVESRAFAEPGAMEVQCNIHPDMYMEILVVPNAWFAEVDADGRFVIEGVEPGERTVVAWTPKRDQARVRVNVKSATNLVFDLGPRRSRGSVVAASGGR